MKTSSEGARFVANEEGFVGHVYVDFAGVKTIGYGHALGPGETWPHGMSEPDAFELLRLDLATAEGHVNRLVRAPLTQSQFDALVSFTFNLGGGALASSTLLKKLNARDYAAAADEMLRWNKYRKDGRLAVSETLTRRRMRERDMFLRSDGPLAA